MSKEEREAEEDLKKSCWEKKYEGLYGQEDAPYRSNWVVDINPIFTRLR